MFVKTEAGLTLTYFSGEWFMFWEMFMTGLQLFFANFISFLNCNIYLYVEDENLAFILTNQMKGWHLSQPVKYKDGIYLNRSKSNGEMRVHHESQWNLALFVLMFLLDVFVLMFSIWALPMLD